jgi:hypothetical protein
MFAFDSQHGKVKKIAKIAGTYKIFASAKIAIILSFLV